MPLGLPKNTLPSPATVQSRQQPLAQIKEYSLPSPPPSQPWKHPQVQFQTTEPVTTQPQNVQTQSLPQHWQVQEQHQETLQAHFMDQESYIPDFMQADDRQGIHGTHFSQERRSTPVRTVTK